MDIFNYIQQHFIIFLYIFLIFNRSETLVK
jgi:hypothetical protein